MLWPLFLCRDVVVRRRIRASKLQVCEIVQSGESFSRLQPLVTKVQQDPSNPRRYKITERLSMFWGLWSYDNSFHAEFRPAEDEHGQGMDVSVKLSQSFVFPRFETRIRVKESEEAGVVEVVETLEAELLCLLVPFVMRTMTRAHEGLMARLAEKVESA